jgi:hypothetical protein
MKTTSHLKSTIIPWLRGAIGCPPLRRVSVFVPLLLACIAVSQTAQAVSPAPDGGYAGGNTAEGTNALFTLTSGLFNTAVGLNALYADTSGGSNTALGAGALRSNVAGASNTAVGVNALVHNTASQNTAVGNSALFSNTTGWSSTAVGYRALFHNTVLPNTAIGAYALYNNTTGSDNVAVGSAMASNTTGAENVAIGFGALSSNTNGTENVAIGINALAQDTHSNFNTACGWYSLGSLETGTLNIALGEHAGSGIQTGNNNIYIGALGPGSSTNTESSAIRIGNVSTGTWDDGLTHPAHSATYIAGIYGRSSGGIAVYVNSAGKLGTVASSQRFKEEIKPMDEASEAILSLKPVTFRYKKEIDPDRTTQFGLVAEQVEKVNPDLVARDKKGKPYTVRYDAVNAMLLNEFLKEHRQVQEQQKEIDALKAELKEQKTLIQKVSARLELQMPPSQTVANGK